MTRFPHALAKGDTIGIVSPSMALRPDQQDRLKRGAAALEEMGFRVIFGDHVFDRDTFGASAGSPEDRASDINKFFLSAEVKAIWCSVGGGTANQTLEHLDFSAIQKNSKIFMGLSDVTVLLNAIYEKTGLVTFHSGNPTTGRKNDTFDPGYSREEFLARLMEARIGPLNRISQWKTIRPGLARGKLVGGNMSGLLKLAGTAYFPQMQGAILLLEAFQKDISDALYQLTQLKHLKVFERISGLVIGHVFSFQQEIQRDDAGQRVFFEDLALEVAKSYSFPILKINEFGHRCPNTILPIGGDAYLDAGAQIFELSKPCLEK